MKTKEDFLKEELNIDRLTPIQFSGILRAMESYAQQQVKNLNMPAVSKCEGNSAEATVCKHESTHIVILNNIVFDVCDNCFKAVLAN